MNQHEILKEYLTALYRAEVVVSDNPSEPLYFNGADSLTDYRIHLLDVELPAIACLREIRRKEEEDNVLAVSVREALLELQTIFGEEDGHATHCYLTITHEGMPVEREYLDATERELLEEYLRLQQASFLRQKKWFESRKIPLPFPGTLPGNDTDIAEIMALAGEDGPLALRRALTRSRMLSSDVSAGFDPAYASVYEAKNSAYLGRGLVFNKYTGARGKSGSNDASAEYVALVRRIMDDAGVSFQTAELGKVDVGGGGTIAYIPAKYGMDVIDSGVPVLSMHSPWEVTSKADIYEARRGYEAFLRDAS